MSALLEQIRSRIEALEVDFHFVKTIRTSMNGIEHETWLLEYDNAQFVYVAGQKNVTLGWDSTKCPMAEELMKGLRQEYDLIYVYDWQEDRIQIQDYYQEQITKAEADGNFEQVKELELALEEELKDFDEELNDSDYASWEKFQAKWYEYLSECLSPLRTADIGDMIVEVDSRYLEKDALSLSQAVSSLKEGPFTLATEDEWEYLCNGGARSLFRWGDFLNDSVFKDIFDVGDEDCDNKYSILNEPNMFGLLIGYDSYKNEIIDDTRYTKGGDTGCSLCGGDGLIYVLPCYTAFYRHDNNNWNQELSKDYYSYRRIIRLP